MQFASKFYSLKIYLSVMLIDIQIISPYIPFWFFWVNMKNIPNNSFLEINIIYRLEVDSFHEYSDSVEKTRALVGRSVMSSTQDQK